MQTEKKEGHGFAVFSVKEPQIVIYTSSALEGRIIFFDILTSRVKRHVQLPTGRVTSLDLSLNGVWIAAGSQGGSLFLVSYCRREWREFIGHRRAVSAVQFTQCDTVLISAGGNLLMTWRLR